MFSKFSIFSTSVFFFLFLSQPAGAAQWTDTIEIKGFASAVYQQTDDPVFFNGDCARSFVMVNGMMMQQPCDADNSPPPGGEPGTVNGITTADGGINDSGSFRRTRIGLNINANVNETVSVATQFLVLEEEDEYKMHLDWGFISIKLNDNNQIRTGKIKMPVGLINEFQSVGYAFPWIEAPQLYYSSQFGGGNITRESYRGLSYLFETYVDDWTFTSDVYWGDIALEGMSLDKMLGYTFKVDWDEQVYMQASVYSGEMKYEPRMPQMLGRQHRVRTIGLGGDVDDFLFYAEYARTTMGMDIQESEVWYASMGYRFGDISAMLTHQNMDKGVNVPQAMMNQQTIDSISIRYDFARNTAVKLELSNISTDLGVGLFSAGAPSDIKPADSVSMFGVSLDLIF